MQGIYETWIKAYALIWNSYCSRDVQRGIKEMPAFDNSIRSDPLELLTVVETLMHTPEKAKYPTLTLIEVLLSFMKVRQGDNEDLYDYLYQFKTERYIVMRLLGNNLMDGYIMNLPDYTGAVDDNGRKAINSNAFQMFIGTLFLRNANHERFGDLLLEYRKAYAAKEVEYLSNMQTMMDVMRQQPIKKKRKDSPIKKAPDKQKEKKDAASSFATTKGETIE